MEKERRITAPEGCEIEKVELVDGVAVVTFKEKDRYLPKSWEEFCEMYPIKYGECFFDDLSIITFQVEGEERIEDEDLNLLPDRATAEAVLALCQLIQLRDCYNGDWVPKWTGEERKHTIDFYEGEIWGGEVINTPEILHFKSRDLRDEFLRNFRPLIEKLKPLYGIKSENQQ